MKSGGLCRKIKQAIYRVSAKCRNGKDGWLMRNKGPFFVLLCYLMWGVLPIFWKTLAAVDSFYVLTCRVVWSMVFLAVILAVQRRFHVVRAVVANRKELGCLVLSGAFVCVNWGLYIWAVNSDHMLDASLAYYMNPILAILLGTIVFREKLTRLQWLSVLVTFTGIVVTVIRSGQIPWIALIVGGCFAVYGALKKNITVDSAVSVFVETICLTPVALIIMIVFDLRGTGAVGVLHGWQWLLLPMAGVATTLPLLCFSKGVQTTPLTLTGVLMYVNPTIQLLLSVWLYHEEFTTTYAILFGFVWGGLVLYVISSFLEERKRRKEEEELSCV